MADTLVYSISVSAPATGDVVSRQLITVIDGLAQNPVMFPPETVSFGTVVVPQGAEVILSLSDVDDAGNYSEPAVIEFTAVDTVPPPVPGSFVVTLVDEVHGGDAAPEPTNEV